MSGFTDWEHAGRPYILATPIAELAAALRRHGVTVGTIGNDAHLQSLPAEDHTPFSATGWPVASPRWYVHALDIMPGPVDLGKLAQQLVGDKRAGAAPWIKYMNVALPGRSCEHYSWEPAERVVPSSDTGHIHLSIRSDWTRGSTDGYDPVARMQGQPVPSPAPVPAPHREEQQMISKNLAAGESHAWTPQTVYGGAGGLYLGAVGDTCNVKVATWSTAKNGWNYAGTDVKLRAVAAGPAPVEALRVTDSTVRAVRVENTGPGLLMLDWFPVAPMTT